MYSINSLNNMRVYFIKSGPQSLRLSRVFLISLANFIVGFAIAWVVWVYTVQYMLDVMKQ